MRGESKRGSSRSSTSKAPADKQTQELSYPPKNKRPARSKTFNTSLRVIFRVKNFLVITPDPTSFFFCLQKTWVSFPQV